MQEVFGGGKTTTKHIEDAEPEESSRKEQTSARVESTQDTITKE